VLSFIFYNIIRYIINMYEISVGHLSPQQFNNLLKGKGVRVQHGRIHSFTVDRKLFNKFSKNAVLGKKTTLKKGAGLLSDIYRYIKERPMLRGMANRAINYGKSAAHLGINKAADYATRGVGRAAEYAHRKVREVPMIEGSGMRRRRGRGLVGGVLSGSGELAGMIGGPGSDEAKKWLQGIGTVANVFGLGMKKKRTRRGRGLIGGVLGGAGELAGLIGGPGSDEARKVLGGIGTAANIFGLGMKKKKRATPAQLAALARGRARRQQNLYGGALRPAGY
jgi:hypothetical protein